VFDTSLQLVPGSATVRDIHRRQSVPRLFQQVLKVPVAYELSRCVESNCLLKVMFSSVAVGFECCLIAVILCAAEDVLIMRGHLGIFLVQLNPFQG
jgi:hypothetical protein